MNKTFISLIIKFVMTLGATWIAFSLFNANTFSFVLTVAIVGTILNYVIGDLFILPTFGNVIAALSDAILAVLIAYFIGIYSYEFTATTANFITFGIIVAVAEYFFHLYLLNNDEIAPNTEAKLFRDDVTNPNMEIANELGPDLGNDVDNDNIDE